MAIVVPVTILLTLFASRVMGYTLNRVSLFALIFSIGILVDGNMEEESTKLKALQVQQQLGIQSLTIANQNTQQILSLFRN